MTDARPGRRARPVAAFLADRPGAGPGSVLLPAIEGTRPILVEVQALVAPTRPGDAAPRGDRASTATGWR